MRYSIPCSGKENGIPLHTPLHPSGAPPPSHTAHPPPAQLDPPAATSHPPLHPTAKTIDNKTEYLGKRIRRKPARYKDGVTDEHLDQLGITLEPIKQRTPLAKTRNKSRINKGTDKS